MLAMCRQAASPTGRRLEQQRGRPRYRRARAASVDDAQFRLDDDRVARPGRLWRRSAELRLLRLVRVKGEPVAAEAATSVLGSDRGADAARKDGG
jgi:hypothetical protein